MFTGLVTHQGIVLSIDVDSMGQLCVIQHDLGVLTIGESISINGVCLTVVSTTPTQLSVHVSPETLSITSFKTIAVGDHLNLERALCLGDRLGGHVVSGHVDGRLVVTEKESQGDDWRLRFGPIPAHARAWVCQKGSVTLDGISLTINMARQDFIEVMVIPHTLAQTNWHALCVGDVVNVEYDTMAKMVAHQYQLTHAAYTTN